MNKKNIEIISPLTNNVIGTIEAMTTKQINNIIENSKKSFSKWKEKALIDRAKYLYDAANLLSKKSEELSSLITLEVGKDRKSAITEIERTVDFIKSTANIARAIHGQNISSDSFPGGEKGKFAITKREPVGVVLAISPFNYPINLAASKIAPALITGNVVIFKPATQGSLSGSFLAKIFEEIGLPSGVLSLVTGESKEIGDYILTHPYINFINFTGSTLTGKHIAEKSKMIPLLMEMGGKDAAIVLEDANLELTAKDIVDGAYSYSGQRCTAIKRVIVIDNIADKLIKNIIKCIRNLKIGNPFNNDEDFNIVPLINTKSANYVEELITDALKKGATLICGNIRKGNIIEPTLIDNITKDMRVAWEEPFGPVLPIIRVKDDNEAIKIANMSEYGLQSSIFTNDINRAFKLADKLEVGTVQINNKTERGPDNLPFLGVKSSGIGIQGISYSIKSMTRIKSTVINLNL